MRRPALACVLLMAVIPIDQPSVTTPPPVTAQFAAAQSSVGTSSDLAASLWAAMMEYQKVVHKERAADRKVARTDAKVEVALKSGKLQTDNQAIERQMEEAAEKAENMMDAADRQLQMGMIGGVASSLGALAGHLGTVQTKVLELRKNASNSGAAGPDLQRSIDRFARLKARLKKTSQRLDEEKKKKTK